MIPEVHFDYAYVWREEEDHATTVLVAKHRQSRAVRAWTVPKKGANEDASTDLAIEGLRSFGITADQGLAVTLRTDGEPALVALRRRIAARHGGTVLEQGASAYEHESMGLIENGIKLGKGMLRVLLFALEDRIRGRLPCALPAFAWLVGHSSAVLTKHLRTCT